MIKKHPQLCPLVLLHGWGFHSGIWRTFLPYLSDAFQVITLDLPGFGNSPLPAAPLTLASLAHSVLERAPSPAAFLGWSLGGLVATYIAVHFPAQVTHLITCASTPRFMANTDWPGMSPASLRAFSASLAESRYHSTLQQFITLQFHGLPANPDHLDLLQALITESPTPSKRALDEALHILENTDMRRSLQAIRCPSLYLLGRRDSLTPVSIAKPLEQYLGNKARIRLLPQAGHAPFLSHPQLCAQHIKSFFDDYPGQETNTPFI